MALEHLFVYLENLVVGLHYLLFIMEVLKFGFSTVISIGTDEQWTGGLPNVQSKTKNLTKRLFFEIQQN